MISGSDRAVDCPSIQRLTLDDLAEDGSADTRTLAIASTHCTCPGCGARRPSTVVAPLRRGDSLSTKKESSRDPE
jgi:hypothetical protein